MYFKVLRYGLKIKDDFEGCAATLILRIYLSRLGMETGWAERFRPAGRTGKNGSKWNQKKEEKIEFFWENFYKIFSFNEIFSIFLNPFILNY